MPGQPPQSPQEAPKSSGGIVAAPTAGERLQAALDARSGDLRARASGAAATASLGCAPGCFVCTGGGSLGQVYRDGAWHPAPWASLAAVTPT